MTLRVATASTRIPRLGDRTLKRFVQSDEAVLILTRADCPHCADVLTHLEALIDRRSLAGVAVGAVFIDRPDARRFRCDNPWIGGLAVFPYVVHYRGGRRVSSLAATRRSELLERLASERGEPTDRAA